MASPNPAGDTDNILVSFLINNGDLIISFIIGLVSGFFANIIWDKYKIWKRPKGPYFEMSVSDKEMKFFGIFKKPADPNQVVKDMLTASTGRSEVTEE